MSFRPTRTHLALSCILATWLTITACTPKTPQATITLTTTENQEMTLTVGASRVIFDPVTTRKGGAAKLDLDIQNIATVRQQGKLKIMTIELRSGEKISGRIAGTLEASTPEGPKALEWKTIASATFNWETPPPIYTTDEGIWAKVSGDGIDPLEIHDFRVQEGWIVRHGTHAYRRNLQETDLLPIIVPRGEQVLSEWDVPINMIESINVMPRYTEVRVKLDNGEILPLAGRVGTSLRKYEGSAMLLGSDPMGDWTLSLLKMGRAVSRLDNEDPNLIIPPQIKIELFGQEAQDQKTIEPAVIIGQCLTWIDTEYQVIESWLEQMRLKTAEGEITINPADITEFRIYKNPWTEYDEKTYAQQWLEAEVWLEDGSTLTGKLLDHFGYVTCVGPNGIVLHVPSYSVRTLKMGKIGAAN